uniref:Yolk protein 3 n=1 Tax=Hyphantria cunea TaxID=39466 RepID=Q8T5R0_HYPCU|nr:yolk protein 3 [Hyphantria cunea]
MKVLYFLALVVPCYAAPIDSPPQNLRATVHQENGQIFFVAKWDKVDSSDVKGYKLKVFEGNLYYSEGKKDDGTKKVEVVAPSNPEKPITETAEYDIPASQNEYTYKDMKKGVVYQVAVQAYTDSGRGLFSEKASFSFL